MKFLSLHVVGILGIFLTHNPRSLYAQGQGVAGVIINGTSNTSGTTALEGTNVSNQTTSLEGTNGSNSPNGSSPTYGSNPSNGTNPPNESNPRSELNPSYGTPSNQVPESVICYINNRINQVLATNSEKDEPDLRLASVFNEQRKQLAETILSPTALQPEAFAAEQAIRTYLEFVNQYSIISRKLESAIEDLIGIETDPNQPISVRYEALMLINQLQNSDSIINAQRALQSYADFKHCIRITSALMPALVFAPLSDEYKKYFQQILLTWRHQGMNITDSTIEYLVRPLVTSPEELEELTEGLKDFCDDNNSRHQPSLFDIFPRH